MFSQMIESLRNATLPEGLSLRQRFDLALVKKLGVLGQPYHCRTTDPKINPPAAHLAWAAFLLEDAEALSTVAAVVAQEAAEKPGSAEQEDRGPLELLTSLEGELLNLAPNPLFRQLLEEKLTRVREMVIHTGGL